MSYLLRRLDYKYIWVKYRTESDYRKIPWIDAKNDIPGDPLKDFKNIDNNKLSLYEIEDKKRNLTNVLGAIGANRERFDHIDYVIIKKKLIIEAGLILDKSDGGTPDEVVNDKWHYDLINLSGSMLIKFAKIILDIDDRYYSRALSKEVKLIILDGYKSNRYDIGKIPHNLLIKIKDNL